MSTVFRELDRARRLQGAVLDALGFAPVQMPSEIVHSARGMQLRSYGAPGDAGPPVLLVPAPIKRAYIWDLEPTRSVVGFLVRSGFRVHLLEWLDPGPEDHDLGLSDVVNELIFGGVEAIRSITGEVPTLVGHSLGGTLAALFSALHPHLVRGLVLLEAPLHFGEDAGAFAPVVAAAPHARCMRAGFGNVPGSFLSVVSSGAAPMTFQVDRYVDLVASLWQPALRTHMRVERWALDELALPGRLFEDVVEQLYREDRFMRGELVLGGQRAGPASLTCPMLTVVDPASTIIPPQSVVPFHEAAASPQKALLCYHGDRGVGLRHVGVLIGANAHTYVWPRVVHWVRDLPRTEASAGPASSRSRTNSSSAQPE